MVASAARKPTKTTENVPHRSHYFTHPPWTDMVTECITTTPDGTRHGVSRPAIKKFVDSKYHLTMNAAATGQLNRAIAHGTRSGDFVLPKGWLSVDQTRGIPIVLYVGPSGKVMLAPKRVGKIAKKKPPLRRPAVTKVRGRAKKPLVSTTKTKILPFTEEHPSKTTPATRKYTSKAKKARVMPTPGRRVPARRAATKRGGPKRAFTGATIAKIRTATRRAAKSKKRTNK